MASVTAFARMQENTHYLSDILAGATLGYIVGRTVVRVNGLPVGEAKQRQVSVSPMVGRRVRAVLVRVTF